MQTDNHDMLRVSAKFEIMHQNGVLCKFSVKFTRVGIGLRILNS
jgi:hypothetical protein